MSELIELKSIFRPAYIDKEIKNLESFFRSVFIRVSKNNEPLEALCFCNFYTNRCLFLTHSDVEYSISNRSATIQIIEYINFVISLFAKIMNSTLKIDSYYICARMFEFIKNNYNNCNETILEFLEKKYPDIKFFKNEFGLGYPEKLLISKM